MNKLKMTLLSLVALTTACTNEVDDTTINGKPIIIEATIGESVLSRANIRTDDGISYLFFANGDKIGLYATTPSIVNQALTHNGTSFQGDDLQWTGGSIKKIYAYFPYSSDPDAVNIWRDKNDGNKREAGFEDMLAANNTSVTEGNVIRMIFLHQFAMLVIKRGDGFKNAANQEVTIQLNKKVGKTAKINATSLNFELQEDETNGVNELETNSGQYKNEDVDYVIVPIDMNKNGLDVNVASITLYNDLGRKMVVPYSIANQKKQTKYVVTVKMLNNQAVVSPEEIVQWDDEDLHLDVPVGIKNETDFMTWAATYNSTDLSNEERGKKLIKYGSYENGKWTFRLFNDIDLSKESFNGITEFKDTFDGQGHTIKGLQIKEETAGELPTGFVRTLNGGTIQQLILEDAVVYGNKGIGAFAGKATTGATIENCKLTGASIIFGNESVGAFIGSNEAGAEAIKNCSTASTVIVKGNQIN